MRTLLFFSIFMLSVATVYPQVQTPITVYTKFGKPIEGFTRPDLTPTEIASMNNDCMRQYPNATFLGNSSITYNCHSYAWNMTEGGTKCWILCGNNNSNISKYWTDDYFKATIESFGVKIHYYQGDHSAVKSSVTGMYESKWGSWPIMRHAPEYGPYTNMHLRHYYCHTPFNSLLQGEGIPLLGNQFTYVSYPIQLSALTSLSNITFNWEVYTNRGDEVTDREVIQDYSDNYNVIKFLKKGIYEVFCNMYFANTNEYIGCAHLEVLAGY